MRWLWIGIGILAATFAIVRWRGQNTPAAEMENAAAPAPETPVSPESSDSTDLDETDEGQSESPDGAGPSDLDDSETAALEALRAQDTAKYADRIDEILQNLPPNDWDLRNAYIHMLGDVSKEEPRKVSDVLVREMNRALTARTQGTSADATAETLKNSFELFLMTESDESRRLKEVRGVMESITSTTEKDELRELFTTYFPDSKPDFR